jgi:hypothetical protein
MFKVMTIAALMLLNSNAVFAAEQGSNPYVCNQNDLIELTDKRYFEVAGSGKWPNILADTRSIKIDQKNKIVEVWTVWLGSEKARADMSFPALGKIKRFSAINYKTMQVNLKGIGFYDCNGGVIKSADGDSEWSDIIPGSIDEQITQSIIEKYKLK